jgi:DNA primase
MASRKGEFGEPVVLDVEGFDVRVSSPERVYFSARGETKLDLVNYYLSVGDGIVGPCASGPACCTASRTG